MRAQQPVPEHQFTQLTCIHTQMDMCFHSYIVQHNQNNERVNSAGCSLTHCCVVDAAKPKTQTHITC